MILFQALMVTALVVMGAALALLGSIKVELARRLGIDEARVGGLISVFGFTLIPVVLSAGFVTDQVGKEIVLVGGCLLVVASLAVLARARNYGAALLAVLLLGSGWSALVNVGNVLTPAAFANKNADTAFATNLANVFFGAGALLTPIALAFLLKRTSFPRTLLVLAGLAAVPAVLALGVDVDRMEPPARAAAARDVDGSDLRPRAPQAEGSAGVAAAGSLLGEPVVWLVGLAFFCYFPLEASMAGWTTTFLAGRGLSEASAARFLSAFWLAYLGTRLATALALPAGGELMLVLLLSWASVAVMAGVVRSRTRASAAAVVVAAGLIFGPIFPTLMAVLLDATDPAARGRAVGMAFAMGGVGSTTIPLVIGACARRTNLQRAFLVAAALAVGLGATALALQARVG